jgi:hypothetical protein
MKYQITVTGEEGLRFIVAVLDDLEQAKSRCEFMQEAQAAGGNVLLNNQGWRSIELYQVEPIEVYQLDVGSR